MKSVTIWEIVSAFSAGVLTYLAIRNFAPWAEKRGVLDIPNERSSHTTPTPRGGGLAIVFFSLGGFSAVWLLNPSCSLFVIFSYLIGSVIVAGASWVDDLRSLSTGIRFAVHTVSALLILLGAGYWQTIRLPFGGEFSLGWIGLPLTLLWIIGLTNSYNFMDGIDGIAGGQAVVAGLGWTFLGWAGDFSLLSALGLAVAASSLGFLGHNWPPARIFMGDVGSAFLGYTFAFLAVIAGQNDPRLPLVGILFVWPFVFDTIFTFLRRWRKGENVFAAHRSHLYQRLVVAKYSHQFVTILYSALAAIGAALAFAWWANLPGADLLIIVFMPLLCLGLWRFVVRTEPQAR